MNPIRWYRNLDYIEKQAVAQMLAVVVISITISVCVWHLLGCRETDKRCNPHNFPSKTIQLHLEPLPPR